MQILSVYLLIFLHMLDTTVVNLLLVRIAPDLAVDIQESSWIITSFGTGILISFGFSGLITRLLEPRTTFVLSNIVFAVASMACALTDDPYLFFVFRLFQGFTSGLVVNVSFAILISLFGKEQSAKATSVWVSALSLAPVIGPIYGAFISEAWGWRWAFLINAPVVLSCLLPLLSFVTTTVKRTTIMPSFVLALVSYAIAAFCFQYTLDLGTHSDWLLDRSLLSGLLGCGVCFLLFIHFNQRCGHQVLEIGLLSNYRFTAYLLVTGLGTGIIFSSTVLLPIWLQLDYGFSLIQAGLIVAVSSLTAAIVSPLVGTWLRREYLKIAALSSLVLIFVSFVITSTHQLATALPIILSGRLILGCGLALFSTSLTALMINEVGHEKVLPATTFNMTSRVFASNIMATGVIYLYKVFNLYHYGVYQATTTTWRTGAANDETGAVMSYFIRTVHTLSVNHVFKLLTVLSLLLLLVYLALQWRQRQMPVAAGA